MRAEGVGQQFTEWRGRGVGPSVDQQRGATELVEQLAATSTRGQGLTVAGDHRHRDEAPATAAGEVAHQRALGAQGQAETRVLDVRALDHSTVASQGRRAHRNVRVGGVGTSCRFTGSRAKLVPRDVGRPVHDLTVHSLVVDTSRFPWLDIREEVASALAESRAVVALESTIVVHGLPTPTNLEVARDCENAVRDAGAVAATVGVLGGRVVVGLTLDELADLAESSRHVAKLSSRELGFAIARGLDGATTVAGTLAAASAAGIAVMATGGLGGVHRAATATYDESADLTALSRTSALVVASGVKSILDIGATLERLDSLGVAVAGYRTTRFPGFYLADSGFGVEWSIDSPEEAARAFAAHRSLSASAMLLANPIAFASELDADVHEAALAAALAHAEEVGARGKDVTPILLAEFARYSAGASVAANRDLVVANAGLAGEVAVRLAHS